MKRNIKDLKVALKLIRIYNMRRTTFQAKRGEGNAVKGTVGVANPEHRDTSSSSF